jgi:hypothetical protein
MNHAKNFIRHMNMHKKQNKMFILISSGIEPQQQHHNNGGGLFYTGYRIVQFKRFQTFIITLLTESHFGITHTLTISLGCGLAQSEGFTISLFCLQYITVVCCPMPHVTEH